MSRAIKMALATVERVGIAPLKRIANSRPTDYTGSSWGIWQARRAEVEKQVIADLREAGAIVRDNGERIVIRFAGMQASSSQGLIGALSNWRSQAHLAEQKS